MSNGFVVTDRQLADELDRSLVDLCAAWFPRTVDPAGGYTEYFDHRWRPLPDGRRSLIHQARLAWTAAALAAHDPRSADEYADYALHGVRFMDTVLRDEAHGGFYFDVESGRPLRNGAKHACALAYAVFAAAKTHAVTGAEVALEVARDASSWLERHCRKPDGTYVEDVSRDGAPLSASTAPPRRRFFGLGPYRPARNPLGREYMQTTMNTHIHLLEAYAGLHRVDAGEASRVRLENILAVVRDRFADGEGRLADRLGADGRERIGAASHGHAIETAALMLDAVDSLGRPGDPATLAVAVGLAGNVLEQGRDRRYGGTFDAPDRDRGDKTWWVVAEAMNTWAVLHVTEKSWRWREALVEEWRFIREHLVDRERGGWFTRTTRAGSPRRRLGKSDAWVDPYHNGRALINAVSALRATDG